MLRLDNVSSGYAKAEVLHSVSLEITGPAIYVVLGPNGAGKTTLFRTVAGVLKPSMGNVTLDGKDLYSANEVRRQIGYLSHFTALPEEMTIANALDLGVAVTILAVAVLLLVSLDRLIKREKLLP